MLDKADCLDKSIVSMDQVKNSLNSGIRVLLLEDSGEDAEMIRCALQNAGPGLLLRQVDNRNDFVQELEKFAPRIVLSDYAVPGFDGMSALKLVRGSYPDLPFVFISGVLGEELEVELLRAGAADCILKDHMSRLPSAVLRCLDAARKRVELAQRMEELQRKTLQLAQEVEVRRQAEQSLLKSRNDLRRLALELSKSEDRELRRIALEIRDGIGQNLVLVLMHLEDLKNKHAHSEELAQAVALLERTIQETRSLALELSPPALYEFDIFAALEWLAERLGEKGRVPITIQIGRRNPLPSQDLQVFLYKAVREMIRNSLRHAAPKSIRVRSGIAPEGFYAEVEDDGPGFAPSVVDHVQTGFGLYGIRERLSHLGGWLLIESGRNRGSLLRITLPANPPA